MNKFLLILTFLLVVNCTANTACTNKKESSAKGKGTSQSDTTEKGIVTGAEQFTKYLPLLRDKNVALIVNHTSIVGNKHLVDTLLSLNVKIKKIFAPEHGFRGKADAGEKVSNETDSKTGLPIISLYGNNKKPSKESLADIDILIFDIQDIGVRFYTYISTMHYAMEACAENNKELIILDRPNPNGFYVSGPVLDLKYKSFVGMHPIPIVHGLTVGELANMINGERWLDSGRVCKLHVIANKNYTHRDKYSLPVKPSPNMPNDLAIQLYPSLGLFEGTIMSVGRGTEFPFQVIGAPDKRYGTFTFTPKSIEGMAKNPPYENQVCYGIDLRKFYSEPGLKLKYLIDFYNKTENKETYFNNFFNKLAGNDKLKEQIKSGLSEEKIRESLEQELNIYKAMRKRYLLYEDF
jgi:uncharacterized protein YbbC (DUF1343 family)